MLKEIAPRIGRVAVIPNPENIRRPVFVRAIETVVPFILSLNCSEPGGSLDYGKRSPVALLDSDTVSVLFSSRPRCTLISITWSITHSISFWRHVADIALFGMSRMRVANEGDPASLLSYGHWASTRKYCRLADSPASDAAGFRLTARI
jgi:hypothetical protein